MIQELCQDEARQFRINRSQVRTFSSQRESQGLSIKWVGGGEERYRVNGTWHRVRPGQFLMVNDGSDVCAEVSGRGLTEGMCLYLSASELASAMATLGRKTTSHAPELPELVFPGEGYPLGQWLRRLNQRTMVPLFPNDLRLALLEQVAAHALRSRGEQLRIEAVRTSTQVERYRRLLLSLDYAQAHLDQPLQVVDLAREASLSEFHFFRTFRQAFGLTPTQWLTHCRMQRARLLLRSDHHSAAEIAYLLGFKDPSHFGKVFRRAFGRSPGQYRRHQQKK
jgi:AraC-like DNA-binding protein